MLAWGLFAIMIWQRRWTSDDGFINFRVVGNILAGHGPEPVNDNGTLYGIN